MAKKIATKAAVKEETTEVLEQETKQEETKQEEVQEVKEEETKEEVFDPEAFLDNVEKVKEEKEEAEEAEKVVDEKENTGEKEEVEVSGDSWNWDDIKEDEVEAVEEKQEDDNWDEEEPAVTEEVESLEEPIVEQKTNVDWEAISERLVGKKVTTEEEFVKAVNEEIQSAHNSTPDAKMQRLQSYLKLSNREIVKADLKASGLEGDEIEDSLDRLEDSGLLKREAAILKKHIKDAINEETNKTKSQKTQESEQKRKAISDNKKALQQHIKDTEGFFGGRVTLQEKKDLYNYITKGSFNEEIYNSHASVSEAAFLWRNRNKIFKMLQNRGREQGKADVLNKITSPSSMTRSSNDYGQTKSSGEFDPKQFLEGTIKYRKGSI